MKNRYIIFLFSVVLLGIAAIQGCTKDEGAAPVAYQIAMPATPTPADNAVIPFTGTPVNINLTWEGTGSTTIKWAVFFGTTKNPPLVATGVTGNSFSVEATSGGQYYWAVVAVDQNNMTSPSNVWHIWVNSNPGVPALLSPDSASTDVSVTPKLKWEATDPDAGNTLTYDIYLDTASNPAIAFANVASSSFTVPSSLLATTKYYWKVVAKDGLGGVSESVVWSFTTGQELINNLVGDYNADEPAEAYSYNVSFTKVNSTTIQTDNYWNSGWTGVFTVDLESLTYSMPVTDWGGGWTGTESGIVDLTTGTMTGAYTIWHNGAVAEQGVHTYTKL